MNKKVVTIIVVIVVITLCVLAAIYSPGLLDAMMRLHNGIPRPH